LCVTLAFGKAGGGLIAFLPGVWTALFSLGIFAARPYLPRTIGWVGLYYLIAGAGLLALAPSDFARAGWTIGFVFAAGQLATAAVLRRNRERIADV
jgi:hypothetical protein